MSFAILNLCNSQCCHLSYCLLGTFHKLINYALKFYFTNYYFLMRELIIFHWKCFPAKCYHFVGGGQTFKWQHKAPLCFFVHIGPNPLSLPLSAQINISPHQAYIFNPWNLKLLSGVYK